jgi:hypothetical protein
LFVVGLKGGAAKASTDKTVPYFNSPSVPSFRMLDDEDDLGNYVEDVHQRRPAGTVSGSSFPVDRAKSFLQSGLPKDGHGQLFSVVNSLSLM